MSSPTFKEIVEFVFLFQMKREIILLKDLSIFNKSYNYNDLLFAKYISQKGG